MHGHLCFPLHCTDLRKHLLKGASFLCLGGGAKTMYCICYFDKTRKVPKRHKCQDARADPSTFLSPLEAIEVGGLATTSATGPSRPLTATNSCTNPPGNNRNGVSKSTQNTRDKRSNTHQLGPRLPEGDRRRHKASSSVPPGRRWSSALVAWVACSPRSSCALCKGLRP